MRVAIVGAGWSGLALATHLRARDPGADVVLFEASERVGGRVATLREGGYLLEAGPHAVASSSSAVQALVDAARVEMVDAPPRAPRFVVHHGRLVALPSTPPALLRTPLLTWRAKLRLLLEPLRRAGPPDESVAAFGRRRLGPGASHLLDAFVTGVYAGDPERLSLRHAFPRLARMDRSGGILRALLRERARPPPLRAPRQGMQDWLDRLAAPLDVRLRAPVESVRETADGVRVRTRAGEETFDRVALSVDPASATRLLGLEAPAAPVAPVTVVGFGVPREQARDHGYGALAPHAEDRFVLGVLFESHLFPGRAPEGNALLRCLVGGRRAPERAALPHDALVARAWEDLRALGVVEGEPSFARVLPTHGVPQPEVGHERLLGLLPQGRARALGIGHASVGLAPLAEEAAALARHWTTRGA